MLYSEINLQAPPMVYRQSWGEKNLEQAVRNIALEYRQQDDNRRLMEVPGVAGVGDSSSSSTHCDVNGGEAGRRPCGHVVGGRLSPSLVSERWVVH